MTSMIPNCPPLPDKLVTARRYRRPCIRAKWLDLKTQWLPVIGSIHSDPDHVRADFLHAHIDYRFLTQKTRDHLIEKMEESNQILKINPIHSLPISVVWPLDVAKPIQISDDRLEHIPENSWLKVQSRQYLGPFPEYPEHIVPWHRALSEAYADHTLVNAICPHQGTDLSGIEPDQEGVITCPLHGLKWRARTGRIVMPAESRPAF